MIADPVNNRPPNYALIDNPIVPYTELPEEVLKMILELLRVQDLGRLGSVSRGLYITCSEDSVWNRFKDGFIEKPQPPHIKYQVICKYALWRMNDVIDYCVIPGSSHFNTNRFRPTIHFQQLIKNLFNGNIRTVNVQKHEIMNVSESYQFTLTLNKIRQLKFNSIINHIRIPKEVTFCIMKHYRNLTFKPPLTLNSDFLCNKIEICDKGYLNFEIIKEVLFWGPSFSVKPDSVHDFLYSCTITDLES